VAAQGGMCSRPLLMLQRRAASTVPAARRVAVLGGGISGLSTAWFLHRLRRGILRPTVVEKSQRAGGWINTTHASGHCLETGPRGFRPQGPGQETLDLAVQLGLEDELIAADPAAKRRYLFLDGKLQQLPGGLIDAYKNPTTNWLPPVLRLEMQKAQSQASDESIAEFITRRFNKRVLDELIDPVVSGVFAGDPYQLSVRSCFGGRLYDLEQEHGSVVKGLLSEGLPWPLGQGGGGSIELLDRGPPQNEMGQRYQGAALMSFRDGMCTLTDALAAQLDAPTAEADVLYGVEATGIDFSSPDVVRVKLSDGSSLTTEHVFSALPAGPAAVLLTKHSPALADELRSISFAPVALVTMAWDEAVMPAGKYSHLFSCARDQNGN
jgi:oxygen-dependent protoporphyrinogen oxidase